jgi:hypothetical protein
VQMKLFESTRNKTKRSGRNYITTNFKIYILRVILLEKMGNKKKFF